MPDKVELIEKVLLEEYNNLEITQLLESYGLPKHELSNEEYLAMIQAILDVTEAQVKPQMTKEDAKRVKE
jgi:hypothetical protein